MGEKLVYLLKQYLRYTGGLIKLIIYVTILTTPRILTLSDLFQNVVDKFRKPDKDPFASRINRKLKRYVSWHPEPEVMAVNAFYLTWNNNYFCMFPPFSLVGRVSAKVNRDKTEEVISVPDWSTQH